MWKISGENRVNLWKIRLELCGIYNLWKIMGLMWKISGRTCLFLWKIMNYGTVIGDMETCGTCGVK